MSREDIVVQNQPQIEVYIGETGLIVIKQVDWPADDVAVTFDPMHAEAICKAIMANVEDAKAAQNEWKEEDDNAS
jgi:hypothetical protein